MALSKHLKLATLISLVFTLAFTSGISQPINQYLDDIAMPSPNVSAMNKYVDIPVNLYSGVPNVNIPLYTIQEGPISVPIALNYHASGVKLGETASWVGLDNHSPSFNPIVRPNYLSPLFLFK